MRFSNSRYEKIKKIVSKTISDLNITDYPIDWKNVCNKMSIHLIEYSSIEDKGLDFVLSKTKDGLSIIRYKDGEEMRFICYNPSHDRWRIKFTIFHEIGHIVLKHIEHSQLADAEADFFAAYLMVPIPLIDHYDIQSIKEIENVFEVSNDMASHSYERYLNWKWHKEKYGYEDYERSIVELAKIKMH